MLILVLMVINMNSHDSVCGQKLTLACTAIHARTQARTLARARAHLTAVAAALLSTHPPSCLAPLAPQVVYRPSWQPPLHDGQPPRQLHLRPSRSPAQPGAGACSCLRHAHPPSTCLASRRAPPQFQRGRLQVNGGGADRASEEEHMNGEVRASDEVHVNGEGVECKHSKCT